MGTKVATPGRALDPANRWKLCETVADYAGVARQGTTVGSLSQAWGAGV